MILSFAMFKTAVTFLQDEILLHVGELVLVLCSAHTAEDHEGVLSSLPVLTLTTLICRFHTNGKDGFSWRLLIETSVRLDKVKSRKRERLLK